MRNKQKPTYQEFYNENSRNQSMRSTGGNEKYPNDNLFKTDKRYKMNKNLEFEQADELNYLQFNKEFFALPLERVFILCYIRTLLDYDRHNPLIIFRFIFHTLSFLITYYIIRIAYSDNNNYRLFIRILFEFNVFLIILTREPQEVLTMKYITSELSYGYISGLFLNLSLGFIIPFSTFLSLILLYKSVMINLQSWTFIGFIKAFILCNGLYGILGLLLYTLLIYYYDKGKRELWALFDSFKRSYLIFYEYVFTHNRAPSFVVTRNFSILHLNEGAHLFCKRLNSNVLKGKKGSDDGLIIGTKLLDYMSPEMGSEFIQKFNNCLAEKAQRFFFSFVFSKPFQPISSFHPLPSVSNSDNVLKTNNQINQSQDTNNNIYEEKSYMVIPSKCVWKNQDCVYLKICPEVVETCFYDYIFSYSKELIEKLVNLTQDSDEICDKFIESEAKYDQYLSILTKMSRNGQVTNEQETINKLLQQKTCMNPNELSSFRVSDESTEHILNTNNQQNFLHKIKNTAINQLFPYFDHTIFFFFKNKCEIFYDLQLTKEIYSSILLQAPSIKISHVNLHSLANYFEDYFYLILRVKCFSLKFNIKCNDVITVEYSYLRIILFNTLMFINNNTDDSTSEKSIVYTISQEKESTVSSDVLLNKRKKEDDHNFDLFNQTNTHLLRFTISICDDKQKNYNNISKILKESTGFKIRNEIDKAKEFNIGIITLYYIVTFVYSKELEMYSKQGEHSISFEIGCGLPAKTSEEPVTNFDCIDSQISDPYYKELLREVFHVDIPEDEYKVKSIQRFSKGYTTVRRTTFKKNNKYEMNLNYSQGNLLENKTRQSLPTLTFGESLSDIEIVSKDNQKHNKRSGFNDHVRIPHHNKLSSSTKTLCFGNVDDFIGGFSFHQIPTFLIVTDNYIASNTIADNIRESNSNNALENALYNNGVMEKLRDHYSKGKLFDIVFIDIETSLQSGIELTKSIRLIEQNSPKNIKTKIIGIGINQDESVIKLFDCYMEKPINKEVLENKIKEFVEKNRVKLNTE